MKIPMIYFALFLLSLGFVIAIDLLSGMPLYESLYLIHESFSGATPSENFIVFLALLSPFFSLIAKLRKKKKENASTKSGTS